MLEKVKNALSSILGWAIFIVPALLYFIIDRQGRTISQLKEQLSSDKGKKDINDKEQVVSDDTVNYDAAKSKYDDLRSKLPKDGSGT